MPNLKYSYWIIFGFALAATPTLAGERDSFSYLRTGLTSQSMTYNFYRDDDLYYDADIPFAVSGTTDFRGIDLSFSVPTARSRSTGFHFDVQKFFKDWSLSAYYYNIQGFFLRDSHSRWGMDPDYYRDDFKIFSYGFTAFYSLWSEDFSLRSSHHHDRRKRSGWSPVLIATQDLTSIDAEDDLVPESAQSSFTNATNYTGGLFSATSLGTGLAGIYNYADWYATGLLALTYGLEVRRYSINGEDEANSDEMQVLNMKIGSGYHFDQSSLGLHVYTKNRASQVKQITSAFSLTKLELFLTYYLEDAAEKQASQW